MYIYICINDDHDNYIGTITVARPQYKLQKKNYAATLVRPIYVFLLCAQTFMQKMLK